MKQLCVNLWAMLYLPFVLLASNADPEPMKGGPDGPHVFYRNGQIVVKSVERRDTGMVAR